MTTSVVLLHGGGTSARQWDLVVEPVIPVAHSSGGLLVPGLADRLGRRVRRVLLIAASVTVDGGTGGG